MNTTTTFSSPVQSRRPRRWLRFLLISVGLACLVALGALLAFIPHATDNGSLKNALEHVESGAIPDEPQAYINQVESDLKATPAQVLPATYSSLDTFNDVTYNAVLTLKPDGAYDYALTVGNSRVFKLYKHSGKWWVQGRVLHTVLLDGDEFLTAPAARDRKTPARERIIESSPDGLLLQAHYGATVQFKKIK